MMGLAEIKKANRNPTKHAKSEMSDGQERRNDAPPSNYWSEQPGGDRTPKVPGFDVVSDNDWPAARIPRRDFGPDLRGDIWEMPSARIADAVFGKPETQVMPENIAEMQVPARMIQRAARLPDAYFEGIKMQAALEQAAADASEKARVLLYAIRDVREAVGHEARERTRIVLNDMLDRLSQDRDLTIRMHVNELANAVDAIAPPNPIGYVPHMGIHHAMHPIRKLIAGIRQVFANGAV